MVVNGSADAKVAIISLDGATWDVLMPWVEAGHLPNIARIVNAGVWGALQSTMPPVTVPAWTSFQVGKSPGGHGLFHFTQRRVGSYDMPTVNATNVPGPTIWQLASDANRRVCSINVPMSYPPQPVNGYMVGCLLSPSADKAFWPPELWDEVRQKVPNYEILATVSAFDYLGIVKFVDKMKDMIRNRAAVAKYLFAKEDWDLFMIHFQDTDTLQHAAWAWIDPHHPAYAGKPAEERAYVLSFYQELDRLIGELLEMFGAQRNVILMSDHGFGAVTRRLYINQWLRNEGYLAGAQQASLRGRLVRWAEMVVRRVDVLKLRRRLMKPRGRMDRIVGKVTGTSLIDWQRTRAYAPFGPIYAGIYINMALREPTGTVAQGAAAEALGEELRGKLLNLTDPATGMRAIAQVWSNAEIYQGPRAGQLPDLVLAPADGYQFATTFRGNTVFERMPGFMSGTHHMNGILGVHGPAIAGGGRELAGARIVDLAPTILYLLGLPVPEDMDGRVLAELLSPELLAARPVVSAAAGAPGQTLAEQGVTTEESWEVTDRLTKLGYLS